MKERWFLESRCGQQGGKTPSGETPARRFAQTPGLPHSNGRRDRHPPERERENYIYHKENENTTGSIQISYLDHFFSLQREHKMRFKHQLIYRLTGEPTLLLQTPFSPSMAENFTGATETLRNRQNSSTGGTPQQTAARSSFPYSSVIVTNGHCIVLEKKTIGKPIQPELRQHTAEVCSDNVCSCFL